MSDEPKLPEHQQKVIDSIRSAIRMAPAPVRNCGECAKCCEGWLSGAAYGHAFSPGRPCFYLEKTCSIYKDRPVDPCRNYRCGWLAEDTFPMWMKPSLVNVIITKLTNDARAISYYVAEQAGDTFDPRALNWLIRWAESNHANLECRLGGAVTRIGSPEFLGM
jgi:hypothetical protein